MSDAALDAILVEQCRELKMPTVRRESAAFARQATAAGWSFCEFLSHLLEREIAARRDGAAQRRIREARFPEVRTLDSIDWGELKGISKVKVLELARCEYVKDHTDVVIAGPIGTGKTLLATALGVEAARRRHRVAFTRAADLVQELREARDERMLGRLQQRLERVELLIVDELGFVPFDEAGGELLFHLLAKRHQRGATIVTTNLAFSEWVQVFKSEKLTTALLDRLGHRSEILTTKGSSYRMRRRGKDETGDGGKPAKT